MEARVTPAKLWIVLGVAASLGIVRLGVERYAPGGEWVRASEIVYQALCVTAYAFAFRLCLKIIADHRGPSTMRTAWLLIALSSGTAVIRHSFEFVSFGLGWTEIDPWLTTLVSLRQIPIALALVLLIAGLIAMWSSFAAIGLGVRWRALDALALLVILAFVPSIMPLRDSLSDANSVYPLIRQIQSASPLLIAMAAVVGLVLHRISYEMGGGQLATSLRYMVAFLVARLLAMLLNLSPSLRGILLCDLVARMVWWSVPWLFLLAVVHRWHLTLSAAELADRCESDPESAIAGFSRALPEARDRLQR